MAKTNRNNTGKRIFINQQKLEHSLKNGLISLQGSILRSDNIVGYYQLIPAIKFTACISNPKDPLGYVGKYAVLALLEKKGIEVEMHSVDYKGETFEVDEGFLGDYHKETGTKVVDDTQNKSVDGIHYDSSLIKTLNNDHKALHKILDEIKAATSTADYGTVTKNLKIFRKKLRTHLMDEHLKLHNYIEKSASQSKKIQKINKNFQKKIMSLNQTILHFIEQYENSSWSGGDQKSFSIGLKNLEKIMTQSIAAEEELYELYLPKSAYKDVV